MIERLVHCPPEGGTGLRNGKYEGPQKKNTKRSPSIQDSHYRGTKITTQREAAANANQARGRSLQSPEEKDCTAPSDHIILRGQVRRELPDDPTVASNVPLNCPRSKPSSDGGRTECHRCRGSSRRGERLLSRIGRCIRPKELLCATAIFCRIGRRERKERRAGRDAIDGGHIQNMVSGSPSRRSESTTV